MPVAAKIGLGSAAVGLLMVTASPSSTAVAATSSRLLYSRGAGAESCPDGDALRASVARLIGYDPFVAYARTTVVVAIEHDDNRLHARIYLDENGFSHGAREFASEGADCNALVGEVALAISIALDPMQLDPTQDGEPKAPALSASAATVAPRVDSLNAQGDAPSPSPPAARSDANPAGASGLAQDQTSRGPRAVSIDLGGGGFLSYGSLPALSGGPFSFARVRYRRWSLGIDGRLELPVVSDVPAAGARARAWAWAAGIATCVHAAPLAFCATASTLEIHAEGQGGTAAHPRTIPVFALGARTAARWPISAQVYIEARADVTVPLARTQLVLNGAEAWTSPVVAGAATLGLLFALR